MSKRRTHSSFTFVFSCLLQLPNFHSDQYHFPLSLLAAPNVLHFISLLS